MKLALITGGTRGIGKALVHAFSNAGYFVCFFYKNSDNEANAIQKITSSKAFKVDVSNANEVENAVQSILKDYKHIDVLVNNAGIAQTKLFTDISNTDWDSMISNNLSSVFYCMRAVLPSMISRRFGRVINIASIWADCGAACEAHYAASKAGVIALTKSLAKELGPSNVLLNTISPGAIQTDMLACYSQQEIAELAEQTPLLHLVSCEDIANMALFLSSQQANSITGQNFVIDGGFTL